jgi:sulfur carrier protein ThiS adenylyltransferase
MNELNPFEKGLLRYLTREPLEKLEKIKIGIAGCGGIGSNCAHYLVRCGFKKFVLIDPDLVDESNLNRQFYFDNQVGFPKVEMLQQNLIAINNNVSIQKIQMQISADNIESCLGQCDVIVEAFDNVKSKKILTEAFLNSKKLVVTVSGMGGYGDPDAIICRKIRNNFYMVGDGKSEITNRVFPFAPKTNIVAAKQADIIFNYYLTNCCL